MTMICLYNIVNVIAWCGLAYHTGHWWVALFSSLTIMTIKLKKEDNADETY